MFLSRGGRFFKVFLGLFIALYLSGVARASAGEMLDSANQKVPVALPAGAQAMVWACDKAPGALVFQPDGTLPWPTSGVLYVAISYVDRGYGKIDVQVIRGGKATGPDRYLGLARMDTGKVVTARMRIPAGGPSLTGGISVRVGLERAAQAQPLWIQGVEIDNQPFADPHFDYVITDPWAGPYTGPTVKPADNTTLKGKVMVGYQGWFRTPNDPDGRGWVHWGDIQHGHFSTDMWPDVSQYPADVLEKAADVHTLSGRQGYLFSSDWPEVTDLHFRWMREYHIDGAFLQRFGRTFESTPKGPDWVLANVRAAANREGRIWAIEYDVSGCPDGKLLEAISSDWEWLVDTFGLLKDPNYARDSGKPVVFIWGMPVAGRNITVATANQVVDFFKNDPKYGGNYVIGGIPGNWQKLDASWQDHFKRYDSVLPWMSQDYAGDLAGFRKMGVTYFPHVKPGFSWANLKHIATGDMMSYNPRQGGLYYWNLLSKAARAGVDRLFVGMFDEYDESTAIIPMSDDPPPTPAEPGVGATFYNGPRAEERGLFVRLADTAIPLGTEQPAKGISPQNFFVRMGGQILLPQPGSYMLSVQGAPGDDARLTVGGIKLIDVKNLQEVASAKTPVIISARSEVSFQLDYRHGIGAGEVRLLWANLGGPSAPVPAAALRDAWGRFLTNDGRPSDWWLKLTALGKEMINGTLSPNTPMPLPGWAPAR